MNSKKKSVKKKVVKKAEKVAGKVRSNADKGADKPIQGNQVDRKEVDIDKTTKSLGFFIVDHTLPNTEARIKAQEDLNNLIRVIIELQKPKG